MSIGSFFLYLLKWIALIAVVILALLLLAVILLLFSPFKYKVIVKKDEILAVKANLRWCFGILSARCIYSDEKDTKTKINIFGIPIKLWSRIFSVFSIFKKRKRQRKKSEKNELSIISDLQKDNFNEANSSESNELNKEIDINDSLNESDKDDFSDINEDSGDKKGKILDGIKNIKLKFANILKKICEIKKKTSSVISILNKDGSKEGILEVLTSGKSIIKSILPKKIKGTIRFGMEDPYKMGQILSVLGITYSLYGKNVTVIPEFDCENYIEGDLHIKGKIKIFTIIKICIKLYMNEKFKKLMKNYKMTN